MSLLDPTTCQDCGYVLSEPYATHCPACRSEHLAYPKPSDEEIIAGLMVWDKVSPEPPDMTKETRCGRGSLLRAGDDVWLYDQVPAQIVQVITPQGWLIVKRAGDDPVDSPGTIFLSSESYRISAALVYAVKPRVETPKPVQRVNLDEKVNSLEFGGIKNLTLWEKIKHLWFFHKWP